jgi:hypothetical protein
MEIPLLRGAERVGFEPTELAFGCFQDSCLQPLGHLSQGTPMVAKWLAPMPFSNHMCVHPPP